MEEAVSVLVFVAGLVQMVPVVAFFRPDFATLYGVEVRDRTVVVLMRNRAVYLGGAGALLVWSSFRRSLQDPAIVFSLVSLGSFLMLAARGMHDHPRQIRRLFAVDVVLVAMLAAAFLLRRL